MANSIESLDQLINYLVIYFTRHLYDPVKWLYTVCLSLIFLHSQDAGCLILSIVHHATVVFMHRKTSPLVHANNKNKTLISAPANPCLKRVLLSNFSAVCNAYGQDWFTEGCQWMFVLTIKLDINGFRSCRF